MPNPWQHSDDLLKEIEDTPGSVLDTPEMYQRNRRRTAANRVGAQNVFDAPSVRKSATGLNPEMLAMVDPEDRGALNDAASSLPESRPMYAKFNGEEHIGFTKPRLQQNTAIQVLRLNALKRARQDAQAQEAGRLDHERGVMQMQADAPLRLENARSEGRLREKKASYEMEAPDRLRQQTLEDEERTYARTRDAKRDRYDDAERDRTNELRGSVDQEKAQRDLERFGPDLLKSRDPSARAALQKLMANAGMNSDVAGAMTNISPQEVEKGSDEFLSSPTGTRMMRRFLDDAEALSGSFTSEEEMRQAISAPLAKLAQKAKLYGGDPGQVVQEAIDQLMQKVKPDVRFGFQAPWSTANAIRETARTAGRNYE